MAKTKLSKRQQEIVDLIKGKPEITPGEIADLLDTSAQAIYQQLSRLRSAGHLPKASGSNTRRRRAPAKDAPIGDAMDRLAGQRAARQNGAVSLEDHLAAELELAVERLGEIDSQKAALEEEQGTLADRQGKLAAAKKALTA